MDWGWVEGGSQQAVTGPRLLAHVGVAENERKWPTAGPLSILRPEVGLLRGPVLLSPADSSSLMHADYSPLRSFQAVVDTASEISVSALPIAVSTSTQNPRSGEWLACTSELYGMCSVLPQKVLDPCVGNKAAPLGSCASSRAPRGTCVVQVPVAERQPSACTACACSNRIWDTFGSPTGSMALGAGWIAPEPGEEKRVLSVQLESRLRGWWRGSRPYGLGPSHTSHGSCGSPSRNSSVLSWVN